MSKQAIVFPGQGSQEHLMGKELAESSSEMMNLWKKGEKYSGLDLRSIYWESNDAKLMSDTKSLQPAQFITSMNYFLFAYPKLDQDFAVAGHSLGEFMALAAAKVLGIEETLKLVCLRAKLMSETNGTGGMCAIVKIQESELEEIIAPVVSSSEYFLRIANYNCPEQFVISGDLASIKKATELLKEAGKGRAIPLALSSAFHTEKMQSAAHEFDLALKKCDWQQAKYPIYSNVTAKMLADNQNIYEIIKMQMISSVRWTKLIENMWQDGYSSFIEIGPKDVLTKLISKILTGQDENKKPILINLNSYQAINSFDKS